MALATTLNTVTLSEMTDLVRREWKHTSEFFPRAARPLFIYDKIGDGNGNTKRYQEYDTETFADVKVEGNNFAKGKVATGYSKDMVATTFGKEIEITLEMRRYNRYSDVAAQITKLTEFYPNREELNLTHRFTFCTSSSYTDMNGNTVDVTVGDTNPLAYATHALKYSSTTYSNVVTGSPVFSEGSYEAAKLIGAYQIYNNFGQLRQMNFNTIVTSNDPSTCRVVKQLLNSMADIDAAQSGVMNVYKDGTRHVILPWLPTTATGAYDSTKRRWWFYLAAGQGANGWQAYLGEFMASELKTPAPGNNGEDIHNLNWTYASYGAHGIAILSGKGFIASTPTS